MPDYAPYQSPYQSSYQSPYPSVFRPPYQFPYQSSTYQSPYQSLSSASSPIIDIDEGSENDTTRVPATVNVEAVTMVKEAGVSTTSRDLGGGRPTGMLSSKRNI